MKSLREIKEILKRELPRLQTVYSVRRLGIFGSYRRGSQTPESDLDILVEFEEPNALSLYDFIRLKNFLSEITSCKVDLVNQKTLKPRVAERIIKEVEMI
ncbi:MAG: nucleotidyltransferase family protein [Chloroherpetonaceae bacterium]|nr:nucleotidyltransferase family protein [Chloroherpetonaceae bacterium]MDW8438428.1 nucleotidyltransferase family protein [Chloroherpetonaceae bacterium]